MHTKRISLVALALSFGLVAGCGGDDADTDAADDSTTAEATPTDEPTADPTTEETATADGDYCEAVSAMKEPFNAAISGGDASRAVEAFDALAAVPPTAPEEIRAEWTTFADSFVGAKEVVESYGIDFEEFVEDRDAALGQLSEEERSALQTEVAAKQPENVDELGDKIEDHVESECGFSLDD